MLQALSARLRREDRGFTLIELMVVVLIIAILIAIAIPTFLGARKRAQDRAAQSSLRNALTAAKTIFTDNEDYNTATAAKMGESEPSLCFVEGATVVNDNGDCDTTDKTTGPNGIFFETPSADEFVAVAYSKSGTCFLIRDKAGPVATTTGLGTTYAKVNVTDSKCTSTALTTYLPNPPTSTGWQ